MRKGKPCQHVTYLTLTPQCDPPAITPWLRTATEHKKKARLLETRMVAKHNKAEKPIKPQKMCYTIQGVSFSRPSPVTSEKLESQRRRTTQRQYKVKPRPVSMGNKEAQVNTKYWLLMQSNKLVLSRIANIVSIKNRLRQRAKEVAKDTSFLEQKLMGVHVPDTQSKKKAIFTNTFIKESLLRRHSQKAHS